MSETVRDQLLVRAAERAAANPFFMASALTVYQVEHGLDDAALAAWLGCGVEQLPRLRLCRHPDADPGRFRAGVEQIAAYAGVSPFRLAALLREADALAALHSGQRESAGLLAARDADEPE